MLIDFINFTNSYTESKTLACAINNNKTIQLSHKFSPFLPSSVSSITSRIEMSKFSIWIMFERLIHILATSFVVIWTDSSLVKICILYPFRKFIRLSAKTRSEDVHEKWQQPSAKEIWNSMFPLVIYGELTSHCRCGVICSYNIISLWPYGNKGSIKGKRERLFMVSRRYVR